MEAIQKQKVNKGKKRAANEFIIEEPVIEYVDINEDNAQDNTTLASQGTTTVHFIKFINGLLDVMDLDENLKRSYLVMDNCTSMANLLYYILTTKYHNVFLV